MFVLIVQLATTFCLEYFLRLQEKKNKKKTTKQLFTFFCLALTVSWKNGLTNVSKISLFVGIKLFFCLQIFSMRYFIFFKKKIGL